MEEKNILWWQTNWKNSISFRDSYLLLPLSLKDLADYFGVPQKKTIFPFKFVKSDNLNYVGQCPNIDYFGRICQSLS